MANGLLLHRSRSGFRSFLQRRGLRYLMGRIAGPFLVMQGIAPLALAFVTELLPTRPGLP